MEQERIDKLRVCRFEKLLDAKVTCFKSSKNENETDQRPNCKKGGEKL